MVPNRISKYHVDKQSILSDKQIRKFLAQQFAFTDLTKSNAQYGIWGPNFLSLLILEIFSPNRLPSKLIKCSSYFWVLIPRIPKLIN